MYKDKVKRREYLRKYQRAWIAKRRADFFSDKVCFSCGNREKLELHHINREEKTSNRIWSWSEERRLAEISKCLVLCRPCHIKKTNKDLYSHFFTEEKYFCGYCKTMKDKSLFIQNGNKRPNECKECKSERNKLRDRRSSRSPVVRRLVANEKTASSILADCTTH